MHKILFALLLALTLPSQSFQRLEELGSEETDSCCFQLAAELSRELIRVDREGFASVLSCLRSGNHNKRWVAMSCLELVSFSALVEVDPKTAYRTLQAIISASEDEPSGVLKEKAKAILDSWLKYAEIQKLQVSCSLDDMIAILTEGLWLSTNKALDRDDIREYYKDILPKFFKD